MPEPRPDASDQGHRGQVDAAVARLNATLAAAHGAGLTVVVSISPDTPGVWFADYRVSAQVYRRVLAPKPTEEVSS